ncbi:RsmB/NOP family class I SAM-dependent RNA methyltransferase [Actibacterium pelagium]|uniref:16S rRNA methyltransferase n=1 Tax=Actibacterium pelagium TaxID=2029103 RepID=A0A917AHP7_9RHOB|nr:transcription antitermination factor NusB [Actibacterium pelagium]GGE53583.1 16S rRNA methyltransferase [Actibacterium pelagium]
MAKDIDKARGAAWTLVNAITEEHFLLSELQGKDSPLNGLTPPEQARAQRLALGTLRYAGRVDALLKPLMRKHPPAEVRNLLRLAVVDLMTGGAAAHGVVNTAVEMIKADPQTRPMAGLVNAVLRRAAEMQGEWDELPPQRMAGWLRGRVEGQYGRATTLAIEAGQEPPAPLDLTPRDGDTAKLAEMVGGTPLPTGSVRLKDAKQVSNLPGYNEGAWWVQDAAAALPVKLLNPQKGEAILDLCAAPGGKTMQLAAAGAKVTALDISDHRMQRVRQNLIRTQLEAKTVVADALEWVPSSLFDAILLDAPCSATGTIRRHPDLPFAKSGADIKPLFGLQAEMIDRALQLLKPGGRLVFCTCSLLREEGEFPLRDALERHPTLQIDDTLPTGVPEDWRAEGGGLRTRPDYWAEQGGMDGFFMVQLRKA